MDRDGLAVGRRCTRPTHPRTANTRYIDRVTNTGGTRTAPALESALRAGWYPHPRIPGTKIYWNGENWAPAPLAAPRWDQVPSGNASDRVIAQDDDTHTRLAAAQKALQAQPAEGLLEQGSAAQASDTDSWLLVLFILLVAIVIASAIVVGTR